MLVRKLLASEAAIAPTIIIKEFMDRRGAFRTVILLNAWLHHFIDVALLVKPIEPYTLPMKFGQNFIDTIQPFIIFDDFLNGCQRLFSSANYLTGYQSK